MKEYYLAMTYDVCEHNNLYEDMNEYPLDMSKDLEKQISEFAKIDVTPIVKVYVSNTSDFQELKLFNEYTFKEYVCRCGKQLNKQLI